jgi:hypothetical protein
MNVKATVRSSGIVWGDLLTPAPALLERRHRGLMRLLVAAHWCAVLIARTPKARGHATISIAIATGPDDASATPW